MIIRIAKIEDAPAITPLMTQLGYPQTQAVTENRLRCYASSMYCHVYVAEESDTVLGLVALSIRDFFVAEAKKMTIEALIVDINHRHQGGGRQLMKIAEDVARTQDCSIIELTSGMRRTSTGVHEFYKKLGYHNEGSMAKIYLRKELGKV